MFGFALCTAAAVGSIAVAPAFGAARVLANWSMSPGGGQVVADASGNGNDGVLGASALAEAADPAWIAGPGGAGALRFSGGQYVSVPDTPALEPARIAVDAWVRANGSPGLFRYVLSKGSDGCVRGAYGLYSGWAGGLAFYVSSSTHYTISPEAPAAAVWDGAWHHVLGTFDGTHVGLLVDGAEVGDGTPTTEPVYYGVASTGVYLGTYRGSCDEPFTGDIGPISVWDGPDVPDPSANPPSHGAISPAAGTPTSLPVRSAGPVGAAPSPASAGRCLIVAVHRRTIHRQRRTRLHVTVRRGAKAAARVRVLARGAGVRLSARTDRKGRVDLVVHARTKGKVKVSVSGQPKVCAAAIVQVSD